MPKDWSWKRLITDYKGAWKHEVHVTAHRITNQNLQDIKGMIFLPYTDRQ